MKVELITNVAYYSGMPVSFWAKIKDNDFYALAVDMDEESDDIIYLFSKINENNLDLTKRELILNSEQNFLIKLGEKWEFLEELEEVPEKYLPTH